MTLILAGKDGCEVNRWHMESEWGDVLEFKPSLQMRLAIQEAVLKERETEAQMERDEEEDS